MGRWFPANAAGRLMATPGLVPWAVSEPPPQPAPTSHGARHTARIVGMYVGGLLMGGIVAVLMLGAVLILGHFLPHINNNSAWILTVLFLVVLAYLGANSKSHRGRR
jgi:hypothetical protein